MGNRNPKYISKEEYTHDYIQSHLGKEEGYTFIQEFYSNAFQELTTSRDIDVTLAHEVWINERKGRVDSVIIVKGHNEEVSICFEIKGHFKDLKKDTKMFNYLGHSDYFFLAVPQYLITSALKKAAIDSRIGVLRTTDGGIIRFPEKQYGIPNEARDEIKHNMIDKSYPAFLALR